MQADDNSVLTGGQSSFGEFYLETNKGGTVRSSSINDDGNYLENGFYNISN